MMGALFSFPICHESPYFTDPSAFNCKGKLQIEVRKVVEDAETELITEEMMRTVLNDRNMLQRRKEQISNITTRNAMTPTAISVQELEEFRNQFLSIDLNGNGLIDFDELCMILDEMNEQSTLAVRRQHFNRFDTARSGSIDFQQFLFIMTHDRDTLLWKHWISLCNIAERYKHYDLLKLISFKLF